MTDKFGFVAAECAAADNRALPTIARMCLLLEVSTSGFYEWLRRPVSAAQRRRELLADKVKALFDAFDATYGYRRIHAELVRAGEHRGSGGRRVAAHLVGDARVRAGRLPHRREWEVLSRNRFRDTIQAQAVVIDWCYTFYNHQRRHSAADGLSPINYEIRESKHEPQAA